MRSSSGGLELEGQLRLDALADLENAHTLLAERAPRSSPSERALLTEARDAMAALARELLPTSVSSTL